MPVVIDREQLHLTFLYAIGGTSEVAQCRLALSGGALWAGAAAAQDSLSGTDTTYILTQWANLAGSAYVKWADYSDLVGLKVAAIGTDGLYLQDPLVASAAVSGTTASSVSPQESVVITLWSGSKLGKSNYGRLYLPHSRQNLVAGTPYASSTDSELFLGVVQTVLNNIASQVSTAAGETLEYRIHGGSGLTKTVAYYGLGLVNDTQRRRRNRLNESTTYLAV